MPKLTTSNKENNKEILDLKIRFYSQLLALAKQHNQSLSELLNEKNKKMMELSQKIEYLMQEQKYEILELLNSIENYDNIKNRLKEDKNE
jgi:hypothetical protein